MRHFILTTTLIAAAPLAATAEQAITLDFIDHIEAGLNELDVFVAREGEPTHVYRPAPDEAAARLGDQIFAGAGPVAHNPFDAEAIGPHLKGRPLGMTLGDWLAADGSATVTCADGTGTVESVFTGLVPEGVYTMWYSFVPQPPTEPFTGALDLPLGARDGSQSGFTADAKGSATFEATFEPCLQPSDPQLLAMLAITWHGDGETYGSAPGSFGNLSHVQLFAPLPAASES
ncbi:hypothetical protein [Leisingera methylohalidivorans]|uniref:Uncharacterized protein n=1 Tax=Leisingera methylohalidivorans DSM 14336 TaxID=999552 RepID=V9W0K2_9RHOB|nr:hypothetical protein [Leisingera methylohalidivorans]AHD03673.1 hypothetical protein METH_22855 [Leisingera methylohalidivorans DSM 14336]